MSAVAVGVGVGRTGVLVSVGVTDGEGADVTAGAGGTDTTVVRVGLDVAGVATVAVGNDLLEAEDTHDDVSAAKRSAEKKTRGLIPTSPYRLATGEPSLAQGHNKW